MIIFSAGWAMLVSGLAFVSCVLPLALVGGAYFFRERPETANELAGWVD